MSPSIYAAGTSTAAAAVTSSKTFLRRSQTGDRSLEHSESPLSSDIVNDAFMSDGGGEDSNDASWMAERSALFAFLLALAILIILVFLLLIFRERVWRRFGWDLLGRRRRHLQQTTVSRRSSRRSRNNDQLTADEIAAHELQRQLNEEVKEQERVQKREERRLWYVSFLKPYTMVAEEKDFFYSEDADVTSSDFVTNDPEKVNAGRVAAFNKRRSMTEGTMTSTGELTEGADDLDDVTDDLDTEDLETTSEFMTVAKAKNKSATSFGTDEEEEQDHNDGHLCLRLPVNCASGNPRAVDAHCSICLGEYEPSDRVVFSYTDSVCKHAFHEECILPWLAKGKKRCPICRHWFVPATKISDQKKELEARLQQEATATTADATTSSDSTSSSSAENDDNIVACSERSEEDHQLPNTEISVAADIESAGAGAGAGASAVSNDRHQNVPPTQQSDTVVSLALPTDEQTSTIQDGSEREV